MEASAQLQALLAGLEADRVAGWRRCAWMGLALLAVGAAAAAGMHLSGWDPAAIGVAVASLLGIAVVVGLHKNRVGKSFRNSLIPALLTDIDPSLTYMPRGHVSQEEFQQSGLFQAPDRYHGRDLVEGFVGGTHLRFSLVNAEERYEETETDSDGKRSTRTRYRTIFCGLFLSVDFNKHFAGRTTLRPHAVGFLNRLTKTHVAIEDPRFNDLFTVSSSDQVEARYLLTPALLERLMIMRQRLGEFHLAFCAGRMYLASKRPMTLLGPDCSAPLTGTAQVGRLNAHLRSMTDVVKDLELNTRIWTKTDPRDQSVAAPVRERERQVHR